MMSSVHEFQWQINFWEKNKYKKKILPFARYKFKYSPRFNLPTWKIAFAEVLIKTIHHTFVGQVGFKSARENNLLLLNP